MLGLVAWLVLVGGGVANLAWSSIDPRRKSDAAKAARVSDTPEWAIRSTGLVIAGISVFWTAWLLNHR